MKTRKISLLAAAVLAVATAGPAAAAIFPALPDACTSKLTPGTPAISPTALFSTNIVANAAGIAGKRVALLVNGNCFAGSSYLPLANHLAENGFVAVIFERPGNTASVPAVFDALDAALDQLGFSPRDPELKIALVGHSVGGKLVVEAAAANTDQSLGYPIAAVATLAPVASLTTQLDGWDVPAFLTLYGSQDDDVQAYTSTVDEAFVAYDNQGTETSTTCNAPPCVALSPPFQKTMGFIYGADHAGLIGVSVNGGNCALSPQGLDYLSATDTLCITKAYLTGFLRWHLWGDGVYKGMLRGDWKPLSVVSIDTAQADGFGNPAGSPLRLFLQNSPVQHRTINAFTGGLGSFTKSSAIDVMFADPTDLDQAPYRVRHHTDYAVIGWTGAAGSEWVRFAVPAGSRDGSTYTHFSLRLGQVHGAPAPSDNTPGVDQSLWVGLEDGGGAISWHQLIGIPTPDRFTDAGTPRAQSHLATRRIPLSSLGAIDTSDVRFVRFFFSSGTQGTVMIDSIEWHRD